MSRLNPAAAAKLEAERKLKEGISGHRTGLPKKLLELFAANEDLSVLTPIRKKAPKLPYTGMAGCVDLFAQPGDSEYEPPPKQERPPSPRRFKNPELSSQARVDDESKAEKKTRVSSELVAQSKRQVEAGLKHWDPAKDPNAQGDPFKTLFISRVSFDVTEKKLRREFEEFGPIKRLRVVHDKNTDKPRGYAFIEFEHKNDMKSAYKAADGRKLEGRRVLIDVERGRTVPGWRPRRFGGGKGGESRGFKEPKNAAKRLASGLPPTPASGPSAAAMPPPPRAPERAAPPPPREPERERERERPLPPPARPDPRERDNRDRERGPRPDREAPMADGHRSRERDRGDRGHDRDRDRDRDRERGRDPRDKDRGRDSDRKREREYEDPRSSKRHREHDRGTRRRERDIAM